MRPAVGSERDTSSAVVPLSNRGDRERVFLDATMPHLDAVHAVARRLCPAGWQADDLVQETYLRAFRSFATHEGPSTRAWLLAICRNVARSEWRRRGRRPVEQALASDVAESEVGDPDNDVQDEVVRRAESAALREGLAQLREPERLAIVLMDIGGITASQVADMLDVPRGTVLARAHRGRRKLALLLESKGGVRAVH